MKKHFQILKTKWQQIKNIRIISFVTKLSKLDGNSYMPSSLTFYIILSLIPLLTLFVLILSLFDVSSTIIQEAISSILPDNMDLIEPIIKYLENVDLSSMIALGTSSLVSVYVASRGVENFTKFTDTLYKYNLLEKQFIKRKARSIIMTLFLVVFVDVLIVFFLFFEMLTSSFIPPTVSGWLKFPVFLVTFFAIISMAYMYSPSKKCKFKDIYVGSYFSSVAITITVFGFSLYVKLFGNYDNVYGPISSIIILLLIIYFSSLILFIGVYLNILIKEEKEKASIISQLELSHTKIKYVATLPVKKK